MPRSPHRPIAVTTAVLLGIGLVGLGAAPAHAVTVSDTATLNAAILADEPVIELSNGFTLTAAIEVIDHEVEIIGHGHTIDADGWPAFRIQESVTVTGLTLIGSAGDAFEVTLPDDGVAGFTDVHVDGADDDGIDVEAGAGASVTVTGGSVLGAVDSGIEVWDAWGSATFGITGTEFEDNGAGISTADGLYGTSTLDVTAVTITDSDLGIGLAAEQDASVTIVGALIQAGPERNAGGFGTGVAAETWGDAQVRIAATTVMGDPDGDRFLDGLLVIQADASSVVVEDSLVSGHEENILVVAPFPDTSFSLLRSRVEAANFLGVCLAGVGGAVVIDESALEGNGRLGSPNLCATIIADEEGAGSLVISRSTISGGGFGGASIVLAGEGATAAVINSTISGNNGSYQGDVSAALVVYGEEGAQFDLLSSTITANIDVQSGLFVGGVPAFVSNTIVSGNGLLEGDTEIIAELGSDVTVDWSVIGGIAGDGTFALGSGVQTTSNPGVGPLAYNGGPTQTHALLPGSVAQDAGDPAILGAPATDQRGDPRIQGGRIDVGSVEMVPLLPATGAQPAPWLAVALLLLVLGAGVVAARTFVLH